MREMNKSMNVLYNKNRLDIYKHIQHISMMIVMILLFRRIYSIFDNTPTCHFSCHTRYEFLIRKKLDIDWIDFDF